MKRNDGGTAFANQHSKGMTLRDYFAGQAMAAIVAQHRLNPCGDFVGTDGLLQHHRAAEYVAGTAFRFADAMIAERGA